jgi:hypothetical protein
MWFDRILGVIKTIMPLTGGIGTAIVTGLVVPGLLEWWKIRKVRCCYRSLLSLFDKFCRSLGSGTGPCTVREEYFDRDSDIESLINKDQTTPAPAGVQSWLQTHACKLRTALNAARIKAGLESRNFYFSRHFLNNKYGELLVVLTVSGNTADMQAFCRGEWVFSKPKKKAKWWRKIKVKIFGYDHPDYSIMLL